MKFVNEEKHLQLKRGDDAVFDFNYIVDSNSGEAIEEVLFGYYGSKEIKQIIAIQTENLVFNPAFNATWKHKIDITADLTSTAKLKLSKVTEETLFDIVFYCEIKYTTSTGLKEKISEIKLEIVCKYATNEFFFVNSPPYPCKALIDPIPVNRYQNLFGYVGAIAEQHENSGRCFSVILVLRTERLCESPPTS